VCGIIYILIVARELIHRNTKKVRDLYGKL